MSESGDVVYYVGFDGDDKDDDRFLDQYSSGFLEIDPNAENPVWRRSILKTKDPFTLPRSRMKCVKWCYPWPGAKICCGHKYQFQWMYVEAVLEIHLRTPADIRGHIEGCLRSSAVVACIAAIAAAIGTGGAAIPTAISVFKTAFHACLVAKIGDELISVNVALHHSWGDWE